MTDKKDSVSSRGRPKASEVNTRVEKLLDIATEVFLEYGYERAKVSEIVLRAGASKSSIYSRYPTKDALFNAVISKKIEILDSKINASLSSSHSLNSLLENFGKNLFETLFSIELRALFQTVVSEALIFPELAKNFWQAGPQHAIHNLSECLNKNPEFKNDNPLLAAETFISLCLGTSLLKVQLLPDFLFTENDIQSRIKEAIKVFKSAYC